MNMRPAIKRNRRNYARRVHAGKLLAASAMCLLLFSGIGDTLSINTYVRDLKGMAIPVQTYNVQSPVVALTFDVGMPGDRVADVLEQLQKAGVKATFFMTGQWVAQHPLTAQEMVREGHEVGQSLYTYRSAGDLSATEIAADLTKTDAAWQKAGLPVHHLFRVPDGQAKGAVTKAIRDRHDQLISWSIDAVGSEVAGGGAPTSTPTSSPAGSSMFAGIEKSLQPGDIIRLRADSATAKELPDLIKRVRAAGYELRTISAVQAEVDGE